MYQKMGNTRRKSNHLSDPIFLEERIDTNQSAVTHLLVNKAKHMDVVVKRQQPA